MKIFICLPKNSGWGRRGCRPVYCSYRCCWRVDAGKWSRRPSPCCTCSWLIIPTIVSKGWIYVSLENRISLINFIQETTKVIILWTKIWITKIHFKQNSDFQTLITGQTDSGRRILVTIEYLLSPVTSCTSTLSWANLMAGLGECGLDAATGGK